ncbi:hypothetical protein [Alteromonas stellipolaris]|jgi:hypothetical protein|uniref:hypothetical protein n=1 Tax=Alteromonas stellipolaris TaxID=233316 RepID=UPI001DA4AB26|nr:hypothetical protein [Alteromonas stellipolaris]MBZ2163192.1 hypothetical protein [Alteromonas stellipolaris]
MNTVTPLFVCPLDTQIRNAGGPGFNTHTRVNDSHDNFVYEFDTHEGVKHIIAPKLIPVTTRVINDITLNAGLNVVTNEVSLVSSKGNSLINTQRCCSVIDKTLEGVLGLCKQLGFEEENISKNQIRQFCAT